MNIKTLYGAACVLVVSGGVIGARAQTDPAAMSQPAAQNAASYVTKAAASDLYEIQSSQLAVQKASAEPVRKFAQMMIEHHTMTTQKLTAAAHSARMNPPPPALEPHQQRMIDELGGLSGAAFDTAYIRQQRMAHDRVLALHSGFAETGDQPALQQTAKSAMPIIRRHITALRGMPNH